MFEKEQQYAMVPKHNNTFKPTIVLCNYQKFIEVNGLFDFVISSIFPSLNGIVQGVNCFLIILIINKLVKNINHFKQS